MISYTFSIIPLCVCILFASKIMFATKKNIEKSKIKNDAKLAKIKAKTEQETKQELERIENNPSVNKLDLFTTKSSTGGDLDK